MWNRQFTDRLSPAFIVTKNGSQQEPCSCILANMDEDDVVMHDVDCSYCDGGFLEVSNTPWLGQNCGLPRQFAM